MGKIKHIIDRIDDGILVAEMAGKLKGEYFDRVNGGGKWLNENITLKLTGSRGKVKKFLNPLREELLGEVLSKNGVEWEWQKQKEREALENLAEEFKKYQDPEEYEKLTAEERNKYQDRVSQARYRSKKWDDAKRLILINAGMELPKKEDQQ